MSDPNATTLARLAQAAGVTLRYEAADVTITAPAATVRAVLDALGHPCTDDEMAAASLRALRLTPWTRRVEPVVVAWADATAVPTVAISAAVGAAPDITLTLEDGATRSLAEPVWGGTLTVDGAHRRRGTVALPTALPLGYHDLTVAGEGRIDHCSVIVAPARCPQPDVRGWGWMVQAYALRSTWNWGQGEFRDIGELAAFSAGRGADFVLISPVHAAAPTLPQQASPYLPTTRRFVNPCYLHVPDVHGFAELADDERRKLLDLPPQLGPTAPRIDRDVVWTTKRAALATLFAHLDNERRAHLDEHRRRRGESLERFATFCALAESHGLPFDNWPAHLRDPRDAGVARWAAEHNDQVAFHAWLQLLCEQQLAAAQERAESAGMAIGIIHDLAVGVDPAGADAWSLPGQITRQMSVGAPPDAFNQQGQNWTQPPLLPEALRADGYRTLREVLRAALCAGGGLRIDHILGLSRLFWIPRDAPPSQGTYVRYPAEEQFAVLALEAHRANAVVIGEDLGTVDDRIRRLMHRRGVAGSAVLYFERTDEQRRGAARYPRRALASVTTHDLPTATGFWDGGALAVRAELDLLVDDMADERTKVADEQASLLALLIEHGCLDREDATTWERVVAMHRFLAATVADLVAATLWDAVGDPRQPNLPGTVDQYPNWRLPLSGPERQGRPLLLEDLDGSSKLHDTVAALRR